MVGLDWDLPISSVKSLEACLEEILCNFWVVWYEIHGSA